MDPDRIEDTRALPMDGAALADRIRAWGRELCFARIGIADIDVAEASRRLDTWLAEGRHGTMEYMERHAALRADPSRLLRGARRVISARSDYLPATAPGDWVARELRRLGELDAAVISVYARGRDYHKVLRSRLQALAGRIEGAVVPSATAWRRIRRPCWKSSSRARRFIDHLLNGFLSAFPDNCPAQQATGFAVYNRKNVDSVFLSPIKVNNSSISAYFTPWGIGALGKASA